MWKTMGKTMKVNAGDKTFDLKEDRKLFTCMLLVSKSRPNVNLEEKIGRYELSVVPRSMFATDGTMFHCSQKSSLMHILEGLPTDQNKTVTGTEDLESRECPRIPTKFDVAVVDTMAEVQSLDKPDFITSCLQLASHFTKRILDEYGTVDD